MSRKLTLQSTIKLATPQIYTRMPPPNMLGQEPIRSTDDHEVIVSSGDNASETHVFRMQLQSVGTADHLLSFDFDEGHENKGPVQEDEAPEKNFCQGFRYLRPYHSCEDCGSSVGSAHDVWDDAVQFSIAAVTVQRADSGSEEESECEISEELLSVTRDDKEIEAADAASSAQPQEGDEDDDACCELDDDEWAGSYGHAGVVGPIEKEPVAISAAQLRVFMFTSLMQLFLAWLSSKAEVKQEVLARTGANSFTAFLLHLGVLKA